MYMEHSWLNIVSAALHNSPFYDHRNILCDLAGVAELHCASGHSECSWKQRGKHRAFCCRGFSVGALGFRMLDT